MMMINDINKGRLGATDDTKDSYFIEKFKLYK